MFCMFCVSVLCVCGVCVCVVCVSVLCVYCVWCVVLCVCYVCVVCVCVVCVCLCCVCVILCRSPDCFLHSRKLVYSGEVFKPVKVPTVLSKFWSQKQLFLKAVYLMSLTAPC